MKLLIGPITFLMVLISIQEVEARSCRNRRCRGEGNGRVIRDRRDVDRPRRRHRRPVVDRPHRRHRRRPVVDRPHRRHRRPVVVRRDRADRRRNRNYRAYRHTPYRRYRRHTRRWRTPRSYHYTIPYRYIYWDRWIRWSIGYGNGYHWHNDYPYFVYNGYLHRYSHLDNCDYELVDSYTNTSYRSYLGYTCSVGYDLCADLRDDLNDSEYDHRYFCSEEFNGSYGPDYDDGF